MHTKLVGRYISNIVYGANDGIITTFAVVSGATGASLSPETVIILGIANLIADGFSMGTSNYLSVRSEVEFERAEHGESKKRNGPMTQGLVTFGAFVVAGSLPLLPFLFGVPEGIRFEVSVLATATALFIVGSLRALVTKQSFIRAGFEMLFVGGTAALIAYLLGWFIETLV